MNINHSYKWHLLNWIQTFWRVCQICNFLKRIKESWNCNHCWTKNKRNVDKLYSICLQVVSYNSWLPSSQLLRLEFLEIRFIEYTKYCNSLFSFCGKKIEKKIFWFWNGLIFILESKGLDFRYQLLHTLHVDSSTLFRVKWGKFWWPGALLDANSPWCLTLPDTNSLWIRGEMHESLFSSFQCSLAVSNEELI